MTGEQTQQIIGVKQFVEILNETLTFAFPLVTVEGEVHSFKVNQNKWVFFDIKDDDATLSCFMPVYALKVPLEDGMKIRATGSPKLTKWGKFSFTARSVELAGEGELRRAFELLKQRLSKEGLFEASRKRPLPTYPERIGLVTSAGSAAYSDFIKILSARWGGLTIELADVQVQGAPALGQIVGALNYFSQLANPVDVVVLIRGGGSLEDLQAFNSEEVARAVGTSRTPVVVGVGHEVDVSLADYAADVRAATPTDAARLVVPAREQVMADVGYRQKGLELGLERMMAGVKERATRATESMKHFLTIPREQLSFQISQLTRNFDRFCVRTDGYGQTIKSLISLIESRTRVHVQTSGAYVESLLRVLSGFSPRANLERGYAIVTYNDEVIKSTRQVVDGEELMIQLSDGAVRSKARQFEE